MLNKKSVLFIFLLIISGFSYAQDIQFSQFYNVLLYQNPAFAGSAHHHRGMFHQRLQWPGLNAKYITSVLAYDTYLNKYNSGFGIMAMKDWQGSSDINSFDIGLFYSYELHLTNGLTFRPGLQLSAVNRALGYSMTLPQDFDNNGQLGTSFSGGNRRLYPDISSGGVFYTDQIWFGISAHHLNRPNQSFLNEVSRLPTKLLLPEVIKYF